jgi:LacI family transcriptional regulator
MPKKTQITKPTLQSIADDLDTSVCTLSRVLNGKGAQYRIAESTQKRILEYVEKVDYRPNVVARGLRLNQMQEVGLILPDFANPFFTHVAQCVANEARSRNYSVQISVTEDSTEFENEAIEHMLHRGIAGLVVWPVGLESRHLKRLADVDKPVVLVDRCFPDLKLPQISLDNVQAAEIATNHLLDHGHHRIACLQGLPRTRTNEDRLNGFRRALANRNIPLQDQLVLGDAFTQQSGHKALHDLINRKFPATAILSFSNQITLGVLRALSELKLHIPDDISLISIDEIDGVEFFASPLTVVAQPISELGALAAEILFEGIDGSRKPRKIIRQLPGALIRRKSVRSI